MYSVSEVSSGPLVLLCTSLLRLSGYALERGRRGERGGSGIDGPDVTKGTP